MRTIYANRGRGLESTVIASQRNIIQVEKTSAGMQWVRRGAQTIAIPIKGPVDFVGVVCGTGRAICFDAKQCALKGGFPIGNKKLIPKHQREYLIRQGNAGAIAGLLVEASHPSQQAFYWLGWRFVLHHECSVPWKADGVWVWLGDTKHAIKFENIPGVTP